MPWRKINGEDQVWESGDDRRREQQPLEPSWLVQCWWLEWKLWWNRGHSDVLPSVIYDSNGPRILDRKNRSFRNYKEVKPVFVLREIFVAQTMLQMFQNLQILGISRCFMQQFTKLSRLFFRVGQSFRNMFKGWWTQRIPTEWFYKEVYPCFYPLRRVIPMNFGRTNKRPQHITMH